MTEMTEMTGLMILVVGLVSFGAGLVFAGMCFSHTLKTKADTGIRIESNGRLYTVQSVEIDQ